MVGIMSFRNFRLIFKALKIMFLLQIFTYLLGVEGRPAFAESIEETVDEFASVEIKPISFNREWPSSSVLTAVGNTGCREALHPHVCRFMCILTHSKPGFHNIGWRCTLD
ncbi:unnamed protein product [Orchesella dallaii]|uniref:Uncharacterized protein n=1 Tax=Orchesella dallaii TaxID=48710 RepID=A0ABP1Q2Z9_9HEXA